MYVHVCKELCVACSCVCVCVHVCVCCVCSCVCLCFCVHVYMYTYIVHKHASPNVKDNQGIIYILTNYYCVYIHT